MWGWWLQRKRRIKRSPFRLKSSLEWASEESLKPTLVPFLAEPMVAAGNPENPERNGLG